MKDEQIICEKAFLYSLWTGEFKLYEGRIVTGEKYKDGMARFIGEKKEMICPSKDGEIYNSIIWLTDRDDQKVIDIMVKYQEEKIEELKKKINNHLNKINLIRGGIKND